MTALPIDKLNPELKYKVKYTSNIIEPVQLKKRSILQVYIISTKEVHLKHIL